MSDNATTNQQQQQMSTVPDEVIVDAIKNHANIFHNIKYISLHISSLFIIKYININLKHMATRRNTIH